jgi:hypothetical protein
MKKFNVSTMSEVKEALLKLLWFAQFVEREEIVESEESA